MRLATELALRDGEMRWATVEEVRPGERWDDRLAALGKAVGPDIQG